MIKHVAAILVFFFCSFGLSASERDIRDLLDDGFKALERDSVSKALDLTMEAYNLAKKENNKYHMTKALGNMGYISLQIGDYATAQVNVVAALESQRKLDTVDLYRETLYLEYLAEISFEQGDYKRAANIYGAALGKAEMYVNTFPDTAALYGDTDWLYKLPLWKAVALKENGEYKKAGDILLALWEESEDLELTESIADISNQLGLLRMEAKDYIAAQKFFGRVAFSQDDVSDLNRSVAYHNLAWSYMELLDFDKATSYYNTALEIKNSANASATSKFITLLDLGELNYHKKEFEEAIAYWDKAIAIHSGIENDPKAFIIYEWFDKAHVALGSDESDKYASLYTSTMANWIRNQQERSTNTELAIFNTKVDNIIAARELSSRRLRDIKRYWPFAAMALVLVIFFVYQMQIILNKRRDLAFENRLQTDRAFKADEILKQVRRD